MIAIINFDTTNQIFRPDTIPLWKRNDQVGRDRIKTQEDTNNERSVPTPLSFNENLVA